MLSCIAVQNHGDLIPSSGTPGTRLLGNIPETSTLSDDRILVKNLDFYRYFLVYYIDLLLLLLLL